MSKNEIIKNLTHYPDFSLKNHLFNFENQELYDPSHEITPSIIYHRSGSSSVGNQAPVQVKIIKE